MFKNRSDAGNKLAIELEKYKEDNTIILAVPRGGIVTAYETIKRFDYEWDLIIPRKIGSPHNQEVAIGAVTSDGKYILNERYVDSIAITQDYLEQEIAKQMKEIKRRLKKYKGNEDFPNVKNKTVIIIDDGIATGFTIIAAINSVIEHGAKKVILAVPVAPRDTVEHLESIVDEVVCLVIPKVFYAVGQQYEIFDQTTDEEVICIINKLMNNS